MEPWLSGVFSLSESRGLSRVPIMLMSETVFFLLKRNPGEGAGRRGVTQTLAHLLLGSFANCVDGECTRALCRPLFPPL